MEIRPIRRSDKAECVALGYMMHTEAPNYRDKIFYPNKCEAIVDLVVDQPDTYFGYVAEEDGKLVGIFIATIFSPYFNEEKIAADLLIYLRPEKRGTNLFFRLVTYFEAWAESHDADEMSLAVSSGIHPEKTLASFQRLGYSPSAYQVSKRTPRHVVQQTIPTEAAGPSATAA